MHRTPGWLMFAGLAVGTMVGCGSSQAITRGQSPAGPPPGGRHVSYGDVPHGDVSLGETYPGDVYQGDVYSGDVQYGGFPSGGECYGGEGYDAGGYGGGAAYGWGQNRGWAEPGVGGVPGAPTYSMQHDYVYPPANVPPSFVQYPYYTHKGPSDFFMQ